MSSSSIKAMSWFRFYNEAIDDEKLRLLAFEDRWHFTALLCCKSKGLLDSADSPDLKTRKIALKLGLSTRELDEVARRLSEVGLVDRDTLQPLAWDKRQFQTDTSAERTRQYRERQKKASDKAKRHCDVTVTVQETETETESPLPPTGEERDQPAGIVQPPVFPPLDEPAAPVAQLAAVPTPAEPAAPAAQAAAAQAPAALVAVQPTMAGIVCRAMKAAGVPNTNPSSPRLLGLIAAGADVNEFIAAASKAAAKPRHDAFAYALTCMEGDRTHAAAVAPNLIQGRLPGSAGAAEDSYSNLLRGAI